MKARNVRVVYRKELTDILRDRRTLFAMFVFPLVIFPIMSVGVGAAMRRSVRQVQKDRATVMVLGAEHAPELAAKIRADAGFEVVPQSADYAARIGAKQLRAAMEFPTNFERDLKGGTTSPPTVTIYLYRTEPRSETAADKLEQAAQQYRDELVETRLAARGFSAAILKPVETKEENVAAAEKVGGEQLGRILPYFIIILCMMGALHPAIDLTAGEKERGTLETILASAVGRDDLVAGKFLVVLTTSLVTAAASLTSYTITMNWSKEVLKDMTRGYTFHITPQAILTVFLLILPMAVLFSATLFTIALFAKNYKEAQSYTGPLMMLVIFPAVGAMLPGVEISPKLALIPIVNISLVAREVLTGNFPWLPLVLTFVSTCVLAGIALAAAVLQFQREEVLFRT